MLIIRPHEMPLHGHAQNQGGQVEFWIRWHEL
eukprot:SAG31_NODE_13667_length_854_cov_1.158940_1_plen_31_part_10